MMILKQNAPLPEKEGRAQVGCVIRDRAVDCQASACEKPLQRYGKTVKILPVVYKMLRVAECRNFLQEEAPIAANSRYWHDCALKAHNVAILTDTF